MGSSLAIGREELNKLTSALRAAGETGQWLVVPTASAPEKVRKGPSWEHETGKKPVILDGQVKFSVGLERHLPLEVPHYHRRGVEIYNFHGPTVVVTMSLKTGEISRLYLLEGGYYIAHPDGDCHHLVANQGGWDNFYIATQGGRAGAQVDKVACGQCPLQGRCALEIQFKNPHAARKQS
ncbi:MAG: hypothetical protein UV78_C0026G0003 [Parcubacteria group bacterium GW2011_GWA2_43_17]|nr:MAG: hypothetical protein UV78_C0026G0003 [Parcubacteria group bacterium GW2011_GWA2_43_17]KKT94272.1 MAG: hypothetical protein UW91_C0004G0004 [Parcubacteria group bacterium GW2011_GWF2_45_11]KKT98796.1 MAG: hypothetical protein UW98_C0002G0004 [Parcubacteria group bacterium GW2011_GWC2_45_15]OGY93394.1 MAG: hypothetical protein A3J95_00040 [Candidatus Komeilibacteria bacterium RIFOXYC2_FULL_45_12]OGY94559.1 MAG: hypothetical protein A2260_00205 [Candidatus Komeilibacteria bacterium RIFOXYA